MPSKKLLAAHGIPDSDEEQFVAMKKAEAWETYQHLLPELEDPGWQDAVPWKEYSRATERVARALWKRKQRRDRNRPDRTSIETLLEEPADPRDHVRALVLRDLTSAMLDVLTEHQRRVMELAAEQAMTYEDIADLMGISKSAVKEALRRARAIIRGTFAD